jgi:hypothetical protein
MFRYVDRMPATSAETGPSRRDPAVPWSWPENARRLLACLAMMIAIGLVVSSREVPRASGDDAASSNLVLDPNTAPPEALAALPHLGPTLARRLAEARAERPFRSLEDLQSRVRGIGPVTLAQITPYLRVEPLRELDARTIASIDDGPSAGVPPRGASRKPPRGKTRKSKASSFQLAAQAAGSDAPQIRVP